MIRQSEIRERVRVLLEKGELDAAETTEKKTLLNEQRGLEPKLREALETEGVETTIQGEDQEAREKRELRGRASLTRFVLAAIPAALPDGAEAEYGAALKSPVGKIPIDIFESGPSARECERTRCDSRAGGGLGRCRGSDSAVRFLPVHCTEARDRDAFGGLGAFSEMTITTSESAAAVAKGAAKESTAGALTALLRNLGESPRVSR